MKRGTHARVIALVASMCVESALAVDAIDVGDVVVDPPTLCCLGFAVPILSGDDNENATATIEYRKLGDSTWQPGLDLLRVRPETVGTETPPSQYGLPMPNRMFAGSLFGLQQARTYEVRVTVTDPDGGSRSQTVSATTRDVPLANPSVPRVVAVSSQAELASALAAAQPGDVISIAAGTYAGPITIGDSGTISNPIVIRGDDVASVIIDASGASYGVTINGSHVYVENITVRGSDWGARTSNTDGVVIRNARFLDVNKGISASGGSNRNFYICDNLLEGRIDWPDVSSGTWDLEGIAVSGQGHVICHNTISGFGDALGLAHDTAIVNMAIDFHGNDVLWTGDDGLELDFAHRNVRAFDNSIVNAGMGVSLQPVWGGPVYIIRNRLVNLAASPYKFNNDPTGFFVLHNTSIRTQGSGNYGGYAWPQIGYMQSDGDWAYVANFAFKNNIVIGLTDPAQVTSELFFADIDYNGWSPDGTFRFYDTWTNFADLQSNSGYESNGRILDANTFETPIILPSDYTSFWSDPDISLSAASGAVDTGLPLANINDGFSGAAPDLGAWERGSSTIAYGVRTLDVTPPAAPTNVRVE